MAKIEADGSNLLLGRGKWYFDRKVSGAYTGYLFLGNADSAELNAEAQKTEKYSSTRAAASKLASTVTQQNFTLSINLNEYSPENLALALFGTTGAVSQTGATVTNEALTGGINAKKGRLYRTAFRNISSVAVKQGVTTLVAGTDYEIQDEKTGLIYLLPTSATITEASPLTIDYAYATINLTKVSAGVVGSIQGCLLFVGDPAAGPAYDVEFWIADISPNGAIALITDDYGSIPLTVEILEDANGHPNDPLYRMVKRV